MLKIYLFGHLRVQASGEPLKLAAPPKTIPLWAYLLLNRSTPIPRDTLAFTIWPDETETAARANLRRHLHRLQRMLPDSPPGRPWLVIDSEIVQWNPQADAWIDAAEFERLSAEETTLASAVQLYSDDLLEDVDEEWLFFEREHLRHLFFSDLTQLIQNCWASGDYVQAIAYADKLLIHDPLREDIVRQLMALRYESGDRAGALAEYVRFERLLRHKLNVEPMPETRAWYEAILRNAPLPSALPAQPEATSGSEIKPPEVLPFRGRKAELGILHKLWVHAARQEGGAVLLSGENGIGKTRLVTEFARVVETEGGRVLSGSTTFTEPLPFQAVVEALRSALPFLETLKTDPIWLSVVSTLVPELRVRRPDLPSLLPTEPRNEREHLFEGLARCLEELARPRPLLLILEDLHWASHSSLLLFEYLARRARRNPILILASYREEEMALKHPLLVMRRRLQREASLTHIALGPLEREEVVAILAYLAGTDAETATLAQRLYVMSQGNPLFLSEIIRSWHESGIIVPEAGHWRFIKQKEETLNPPTRPFGRIHAAISGRLARLSQQARGLAEIAAVIGPSFDLDLVRETAGWSEMQTLRALDELMDRHLVGEMGTRQDYDYTFRHPLIQSALYNEIPAPVRMHRHHRVAHVMEELYTSRLDDLSGELAKHFERAGEAQPAASYYLKFARKAAAMHANEQALEVLQHALELDSEAHTRFELLSLQGTILSRRGDKGQLAENLAQLEQLAYTLQDETLICESLHRRILYEHANGNTPEEAGLVELLKSHAVASGQVHWQAEALQDEAFFLLQQGKFEPANQKLHKALQLHRVVEDASGQVTCFCGLAEVAIQQGRLEEVPRLLESARSLSASHLDPSLEAEILRVACRTAIFEGKLAAAQALGRRALELYQSCGDRRGAASLLSKLAVIATRLDQPQKAQEYIDQSWMHYTRLGQRAGQARLHLIRGELSLRMGKQDQARQAFQDAEAIYRELKDTRRQAGCAVRLSALANQRGTYLQAKEAARRALKLAHQTGDPVLEVAALTNLASSLRQGGNPSRALKYLRSRPALEKTTSHPLVRSAAAREQALSCLELGQLPEARRAAEAMLSIYTSARRSIIEPELIWWAAARVYRALDMPERAREMLNQAHAAVRSRMAAISDPEIKAAYLAQRDTSEILAAHENDEWP